MNAERDRGKPRPGWLRLPLLFLAASTLGGSLWALPFPRSFYDDFPAPGWGWVSTLGPYNEHLVRDYGAMNLALGVLLVSAAIFLEKRLTQVRPAFSGSYAARALACCFSAGWAARRRATRTSRRRHAGQRICCLMKFRATSSSPRCGWSAAWSR